MDNELSHEILMANFYEIVTNNLFVEFKDCITSLHPLMTFDNVISKWCVEFMTFLEVLCYRHLV